MSQNHEITKNLPGQKDFSKGPAESENELCTSVNYSLWFQVDLKQLQRVFVSLFRPLCIKRKTKNCASKTRAQIALDRLKTYAQI